MKARFLTLILLSLAVLGVAAIDGYAATLTVTKTADTNDGICDSDCSLREAVAVAAPGDTVVFSSLFNSPQTIRLTLGQMNLSKNLTINGPGSDLLSVSANNTGRIFYISGGVTVSMTGMKLRDGNVGATFTDSFGGAIRILDGSLNLAAMEFTHNAAFYGQSGDGYGGAVYGYNCTLNLANVNVNQNIADGGAIEADSAVVNVRDSAVNNNTTGVHADTVNLLNSIVAGNPIAGVSGRQLTVVNSRIVGNGRGVVGGDASSGITIENSTITENTDGGLSNSGLAMISNTIINNNQKSGEGGGITNTNIMYIVDSAITGNTATQNGGGIRSSPGSQLFATNSTISGNIAGTNLLLGLGGGIYGKVQGGPANRVVLVNCTISNNRTTGGGGGLRQDAQGTTTIRNTIIAGNTSANTSEQDVSGTVISEGVNLIGNTNGSSGWIAIDLLNRNPLLAPLGNNGGGTFTLALLPGSPAINAGNNALAVDPQTMLPLTTDQRGFARFIGGGRPVVDIGAYEASYSSSPVIVSGRIVNITGRGIDRVRVKLDDGLGNVVYTQTNPFGYYRFVNLTPGTTYTITVIHKYYSFNSPQVFTADQNRDDFNFMANS